MKSLQKPSITSAHRIYTCPHVCHSQLRGGWGQEGKLSTMGHFFIQDRVLNAGLNGRGLMKKRDMFFPVWRWPRD